MRWSLEFTDVGRDDLKKLEHGAPTGYRSS